MKVVSTSSDPQRTLCKRLLELYEAAARGEVITAAIISIDRDLTATHDLLGEQLHLASLLGQLRMFEHDLVAFSLIEAELDPND